MTRCVKKIAYKGSLDMPQLFRVGGKIITSVESDVCVAECTSESVERCRELFGTVMPIFYYGGTLANEYELQQTIYRSEENLHNSSLRFSIACCERGDSHI
jgi:hypothetical protein